MDASPAWYEKIPVGPMVLLTIVASIAAAMVQQLVWLGICLVAVVLLWIGVIWILVKRFGGS